MASACVNNSIGMSAESFPSSAATYGWLSPRISFSRDEEAAKVTMSSPSRCDAQLETVADFEFLLGDDPVDMLPADELFSDGKLVPLAGTSLSKTSLLPEAKPLSQMRSHRQTVAGELSICSEAYFSPKAPTCTSRWKELLGLRKLHFNSSKPTQSSPNHKSLKNLLNRNARSASSASNLSSSNATESSLNLPLLKDASVLVPDCEPISISSCRLSLSSTSSHEVHDDHPRLSLDADKPSLGPNPFLRNPNPNPGRIRMGRKSAGCAGADDLPSLSAQGGVARTISMDSPRMNASGKIVFHTLERSSSSPSTFNGGNRVKHRGMERSYSANVRVTPVLNVPVCSLRGSSKPGSIFGFGPLFTSAPVKKEAATGVSKATRNRVDRP